MQAARFNKSALTLACAIGAVLGLGSFTFDYGEGTSYFSTNPMACANCHVMNDHYASWSNGGHHHVAVCVDCHLPEKFIPKYLSKADNGYWHSKGFTFMDFHDPIMIKPRNARIVQENCIRCHADFVHELVAGSRSKNAAAEGISCVHCHRGVGHGARSVGGAGDAGQRAAEWLRGAQP